MPVPIVLDHQSKAPKGALLVIGVRQGHLDDDAPGLDPTIADFNGFEGKAGQTLFAEVTGGHRLLVGLGEDPEPADLRKVGATVAKAVRKHEAVAVDALGPFTADARVEAAEALALGLALGSYAYADYKDVDPDEVLESVTVVGKGGKAIGEAVARADRIAGAVALARDLVNTPGGDLTPEAFADFAADLADEHGLEFEAWDRDKIKTELLGGLAGVSRGSAQEPRFVKLSYVPDGKVRRKVALVGKGVTFDAGGLSIKTSAGMDPMKTDMAGAAAVLAAMTLVASVAPKVAVAAYLPLTDNMLGGDATRVGDILRIRNGKTVEVLNTDAEGRLILADALSLAVEDEPDVIVDLATLTGACMVALGDRTAGVMTNDDELAEAILDAGEAVGEALWPLPLPKHLRDTLDSPIADLRNISTGPYGGALTAGLFLKEFVGDIPWVHLDIAGPSNSSTGYDEVSKGGTGFAVRTIANYLGSI